MDYHGHETTDFVSKIRVERRKAQKPKIEKLRRDRINGSLDEIKHLVLEALNKDSSRYSKMEKADILEMTVQFLKGAHASKRLQAGIRSQSKHTSELRSESSTSQISRLAQDQLLVRMNADIQPMPMLSPFVSPSMVAMATQPTIVWLPYPSPPPSPTEQESEKADSAIKPSDTNTGNESRFPSRTCGSASVTSPSNAMFPVWRPW